MKARAVPIDKVDKVSNGMRMYGERWRWESVEERMTTRLFKKVNDDWVMLIISERVAGDKKKVLTVAMAIQIIHRLSNAVLKKSRHLASSRGEIV